MKKIVLLIFMTSFLFSCMTNKNVTIESIENKYTNELENNIDNWNLAHYIAAFGTKHEMNVISENTDLINSQDNMGNTPIIVSQLFNNLETFESLISNNCDVTIYNNMGGVPAIYMGYFEKNNYINALKIYTDAGHSIDRTGYQNTSLLHYAVRGANVELVQEIVKYDIDYKKTETGHNFYPIDMTSISSYKYTDIIEFDDTVYEKENKIKELLLRNGSEPAIDLPLQMGNFGNFFFNVYVNIESLVNERIPLQEINTPDVFEVLVINNRPHAIMTKDILTNLFEKYGFNIEITNIDSDFKNEISKMAESEDRYTILINVSNNPYASNYWVTFQGFIKDSYYSDFFKVYNSDSTFNPMLFRYNDISKIISIKSKKIE